MPGSAPLFKEGFVMRKNIMEGSHKKGGCTAVLAFVFACKLHLGLLSALTVKIVSERFSLCHIRVRFLLYCNNVSTCQHIISIQ